MLWGADVRGDLGPVTPGSQMMIFADARSGRILWQDAAAGQGPPPSEQVVKNAAQGTVRPLR
jgi:hypothetical protein